LSQKAKILTQEKRPSPTINDIRRTSEKQSDLAAHEPQLPKNHLYEKNKSMTEIERNDQSIFQSIADLSEIFPQPEGECDESANHSLHQLQLVYEKCLKESN